MLRTAKNKHQLAPIGTARRRLVPFGTAHPEKWRISALLSAPGTNLKNPAYGAPTQPPIASNRAWWLSRLKLTVGMNPVAGRT